MQFFFHFIPLSSSLLPASRKASIQRMSLVNLNCSSVVDIYEYDIRKTETGSHFGGGVTRGRVHIGTLQAQEENGIRPDYLYCTSIGAFAAAMYAFGVSLHEKPSTGQGMTPLRVSKQRLPRFALLSNEELGKLIEAYIGNARIEDAPIPLAIMATDITSGEKVMLRKGEITQAVMAISAVAGIYLPVCFDGRMLMDGGIIEDVPISPLRPMVASVVVAVNLSAERKYRVPEDIIDILF